MGKIKERSKHIGIEEPLIPSKRTRNGKLLSGNETQFYYDIEVAIYFTAIDTLVACIQNLTNQTFEHVKTLSNFFQTH